MSTWDPFEDRPAVLGERYRIESVLGEGGSGCVYEATDTKSGAHVAVKLVEAPALQAPLRFLAEARDMARLKHPRVVRVLDAGRDGSWYWMTMELMRGGSLKQKVEAEGPLAPSDALTRIYEVLQGLHAVHAASLVHRDVKPHNVLLDDDGHARLTDFGLARHEAGDVPWKTRTGESLGSPTYRAPEQARNPGAAGREADIYGTGAVLYFVVTGRRPTFFYMMDDGEFAKETANVCGPIAEVVRRAMSHLPEERYRTAFEMAAAVAAAMDALPERSQVPRVSEAWTRNFERVEVPPEGLWGRFRAMFDRS
jgi:eukaryotic-like serine/threonine-protein kinase